MIWGWFVKRLVYESEGSFSLLVLISKSLLSPTDMLGNVALHIICLITCMFSVAGYILLIEVFFLVIYGNKF